MSYITAYLMALPRLAGWYLLSTFIAMLMLLGRN
jgi:hypothetical protein